MLPFDNSQTFVTAAAVANQDPTQAGTVAVTVRDQNGSVLGNSTISPATLGRQAFTFPAQFPMTSGLQGVAEFTSPNVDLSALGLRFNPLGSFTSIQPMKNERALDRDATSARSIRTSPMFLAKRFAAKLPAPRLACAKNVSGRAEQRVSLPAHLLSVWAC